MLTEKERTAKLIKPILRGKDIKRYGYEWVGLWLINTHNGYEIPTCHSERSEESQIQHCHSERSEESQFSTCHSERSEAKNLKFNIVILRGRMRPKNLVIQQEILRFALRTLLAMTILMLNMTQSKSRPLT